MFDMIGNIFKNMSQKPATRKYPFEKRPTFAGVRGCIKGIKIETCIFCGICVRKCPSDALVVDRANKTWELDPFKCVICGACAEVCPKQSIIMDEQHGSPAGAKAKLKFTQPQQPAKDSETQVG